MEEGVNFVKKKSSSGCLIIKKRADGVGGVGASRPRKAFESSKERKRPRLVVSDSGSSEESSEPLPRKVVPGRDEFRNGSVVYGKGILEDSRPSRNGDVEIDRKRSLDVFEFDEREGVDGKRVRRDYLHDRLKLTGQSGREREFETGSSRHGMAEKRKNSYFDGTNNSSGSGGRKFNCAVNGRFEIGDEEYGLPLTSLRHKFHVPSDKPIRLQGKNGVLKVMVNKNKMDVPPKFYGHQLGLEDRKGSKSENAVKKTLSTGPLFYPDSKRPEKPSSFVKAEKKEPKLPRPSSKSGNAGDSETENSNTSLRPGPRSAQASNSPKRVKREGKALSAVKMTPARENEVKVKRGSGTEKQLLREKIRHMLVSAGWTIDYRPRRNRDYLDAVYINPSGTAYWSIIKAYDALQKQLEEDDADAKPSGDSSQFAPLPEEMLSKLTRQTRKKIEKEMKKKQRDHGRSKKVKERSSKESAEDTDGGKDNKKLSFFMKNSRPSKGRSHETTYASGDDSTGNLHKGSSNKERAEKSLTTTNSRMIQGRKTRKIGRCTLLVRNTDKGLDSESDGYVPYSGKRTVLSWLIDSGMVHLSEKVQYMNRRRTRVMLEGWITRDGIHCGCCSKILTVSKFEIHAGSKLRQPFQNIFLESGISLLQCQMDAWNRQEEFVRCGFHIVNVDGDDPNDDTCGLCGDGGDLICCDGCPSTFHLSCLDIQMLPPGDWHCPNCTCKFCRIAGGNSAQRNCTMVNTLFTCNLCDKKYHESCSRGMDALPADSDPDSTSFCGRKCQVLFDHLQKLIGIKHELEGGFSWSLIHRTDLETDASNRGFPQRVESNSKLAVALSVMDECFLPIVDRRSGINLIHNVLYNCGSNFSRLNYSGFYTAILERGDEIVSAASIRIHGNQLAEMPFIGTRHIYRRQGMCRRLFYAIESALCSLKVEKLIIPAIAEHMQTWTTVFGFNPLEESYKQELRSINMLVFPGIDMLQKLLVENKTNEGISANSGLHNDDGMANKSVALDSGPQVTSSDNTRLNYSLDVPSEPKLKVFSKEKTTPAKKSTEAYANSKCPSSSDEDQVCLEMENVSDPSVKSSSTEETVDDVHGPVFDSVGETLTVNIIEEIKMDKNPLPISTMNQTGVTTRQENPDLSSQSAFGVECKLPVVLEAPEANTEPAVNIQCSAEGYDDDARCVKMKGSFGGPIDDTLVETSAEYATEGINENQNPVFVSSPAQNEDFCEEDEDPIAGSTVKGLDKSTIRDLNKQSAIEVESNSCAAPVVASDEEVAVVGRSICSAADDDMGKDAYEENVMHAPVRPICNSSVETAIENATKEIKETATENAREDIKESIAISTLQGSNRTTVHFESDQDHHSAFEMEAELHMDSEDI
ncbi:uncharacterized protein LOC127811532 isoform X2 [Diospyros lotus]|uniref:uncharacterized protein LOC127811532 isoform X2 n=1 Tax=Diospyros lotus TaxID=55363 RepID=UPI00225BFB41|nr:uncharacterized protein LOC127811532 isoform X2 [Diospyros lotus]